MKLLLDQNLSPHVCARLAEAGIESVHVRDVGLSHASDTAIIDYARQATMVIVSQDSDFTNLLAHQGTAHPSLILLRIQHAVTASDNLGGADRQPGLGSQPPARWRDRVADA